MWDTAHILLLAGAVRLVEDRGVRRETSPLTVELGRRSGLRGVGEVLCWVEIKRNRRGAPGFGSLSKKLCTRQMGSDIWIPHKHVRALVVKMPQEVVRDQ